MSKKIKVTYWSCGRPPMENRKLKCKTIRKLIRKNIEITDFQIVKKMNEKEKTKICLTSVRNLRREMGIKNVFKRSNYHWKHNPEVDKNIFNLLKSEPKNKPWSDYKLSRLLKIRFNISRTARSISFWRERHGVGVAFVKKHQLKCRK